MSVGAEIWRQLGGKRFEVMTGANHFVSDKNSLRMILPRNGSKANRLEVTLNGLDLYDMRFYRQTGGTWDSKKFEFRPIKVVEDKTYTDIYCDQLEEIFTQHTGMYTRLF